MCFGRSNEKRLFSGFAYFEPANEINSTVFATNRACMQFSQSKSLESLRNIAVPETDPVNEVDTDEEDLSAERSLSVFTWSWTDYSTMRKGFRHLGQILPMPMKGVYKVADDNSSIPMPLVWTVQYTCPAGHFNPMASLMLNTVNRSVRLLFVRGSAAIIPFSVLTTFFVLNGLIILLVIGMGFLPGKNRGEGEGG